MRKTSSVKKMKAQGVEGDPMTLENWSSIDAILVAYQSCNFLAGVFFISEDSFSATLFFFFFFF
jgi:hypothetical protein